MRLRGDVKSAADTAQQMLHDPIDFLSSQVTDRQGRVNANVRKVARDEMFRTAAVIYVLWRLTR